MVVVSYKNTLTVALMFYTCTSTACLLALAITTKSGPAFEATSVMPCLFLPANELLLCVCGDVWAK